MKILGWIILLLVPTTAYAQVHSRIYTNNDLSRPLVYITILPSAETLAGLRARQTEIPPTYDGPHVYSTTSIDWSFGGPLDVARRVFEIYRPFDDRGYRRPFYVPTYPVYPQRRRR